MAEQPIAIAPQPESEYTANVNATMPPGPEATTSPDAPPSSPIGAGAQPVSGQPMPAQATGQPPQAQPAIAKTGGQPASKHSRMGNLFHSLMENLGGYDYSMTAAGDMQRVPRTGKGSIAKGILAGAITGMAAAEEHRQGGFGTGAVVGAAAGMQKREGEDKEAQANTIALQNHKMAVARNNIDMYRTAQAIGKGDMEMSQTYVDGWKPYLDGFIKAGAIVPGTEAGIPVSEFKQYNATTHNAIPVGVVPRLDKNGEPTKGNFHQPEFDVMYAVVDPTKMVGSLKEAFEQAFKYNDPLVTNPDGSMKVPAGDARNQALVYMNIGNRGAAVNYTQHLLNDFETEQPAFGAKSVNRPIWDNMQMRQADTGEFDFGRLADAMASHEGMGGKLSDGTPNRPTRNNNPGNLKQEGDLGHDKDGFAVYSDPELGRFAMINDLKAKMFEHPTWTLADIIHKWSNDSYPGNKPGDEKAYVDDVTKKLGLSEDMISTPKLFDKAPDIGAWIKANPAQANQMIKAIQDFTTYAGMVTSDKENGLSLALEAMSKDEAKPGSHLNSGESALITQLFGGAQKIRDYQNGIKSGYKLNDEQQKNQIKWNEKRQEMQVKEQGLEKSAKETAEALLKPAGAYTRFKDVTPLRGDMRSRVFRWLGNLSGGKYNTMQADLVYKTMTDFASLAPNKPGGKIASFNAFLGHTGEAYDMTEKWKNTTHSMNDISSWLTTPLNKIAGGANSADLEKFKAAIQPVRDEYATFLNNNFAVPVEEKKEIEKIIDFEHHTPTEIVAALQQLSSTAAVRMAPINDAWKRVVPDHGNFPDLLNEQSVRALKKINDPETNRLVQNFESGGTMTGGPIGAGEHGNTVGNINKTSVTQTDWTPPPGLPDPKAILQQGNDRAKDSTGKVVAIIKDGKWAKP